MLEKIGTPALRRNGESWIGNLDPPRLLAGEHPVAAGAVREISFRQTEIIAKSLSVSRVGRAGNEALLSLQFR